MTTSKEKKVIFSMPESEKAKFKVQLQYDSLTQRQFFQGIMAGYVEQEADLMSFINTLKADLKVQSRIPRNKVEKNIKERAATRRKFALGDEEVENIFDMLEQEYPDL